MCRRRVETSSTILVVFVGHPPVPFLIRKDEKTSGLEKEYVLATYTCNTTFVVTRNSWGFPKEMIGVRRWLRLIQHFGHVQIGLGIVNVLNRDVSMHTRLVHIVVS